MATSNYYNDYSEFIDAGNAYLDGFDFFLEEDGGDGEPLFDNGSKGTSNLDGLLSNSRGSAAMDLELETLERTLNNMRVGTIQEDEDCLSSYNADYHHPRRSQRDHTPSPHAHKQQRFQMNEVKFEPPAQQQHFTQHQRQASPSNLSMSSFSTAISCSAQPTNKGVSKSTAICQHSEAQYNEALQKLANSMKRTEESRRHVMMQRNMLSLDQQRALYLAKEQLQQQNQQVQSSIMTSFFTGSRSTLTDGLEQSRKQIRMYMGQVNHQTL